MTGPDCRDAPLKTHHFSAEMEHFCEQIQYCHRASLQHHLTFLVLRLVVLNDQLMSAVQTVALVLVVVPWY